MSRGILFFASNNTSVNYLKIALANAYMCKRYLGEDTKITVVTSTTSLEANSDLIAEIESVFDKIVVDDATTGCDNLRRYSNTQYYSVKDRFINGNRNSAYDLSPYDETILLDVDFLIQDSTLNFVWGSDEELMINDVAIGLDHKQLAGEERRLNPAGIKMVWATVVYFKKSPSNKLLFGLIGDIKTRWTYYQLLYGFTGSLYRNDFAFSIALHTLGGLIDDTQVSCLPTPYILTSTDRDQLYKVEEGAVTIFHNDISYETFNHDHEFYITKIKGQSIHVMNKLSLLACLDTLLEIYRNE